jgi:hypothetical protein
MQAAGEWPRAEEGLWPLVLLVMAYIPYDTMIFPEGLLSMISVHGET